MQTNGMVDCQIIFNPEGDMKMNQETQETVGDRLKDLLRDQGRRDRGVPYTQYELCDFLTGAVEAPNGKRYTIKTSRSVVNRYLNDGQEMTYEIIVAICEIFHTTADWLIRGEINEEDTKEQWLHEDTGQIASIVDTLPDNLRQTMMAGATILKDLSSQIEQMEIEQVNFLQRIKTLLPEQERLQAISILEKMSRIGKLQR